MTLNELLINKGKSVKDITQIYRGKDHACRCGCCGRYFKAGEKGFTRAINEMSKTDFYCFNVEYGDTYINIPYDYDNDKCFCIYFD
jgi:hypothetical protein